MATLARAGGWLDEAGDQDRLTVELASGQRYFFEVLGGAFADARAALDLLDPAGNPVLGSWQLSGGRLDSFGFAFVAPVGGSYSLVLTPRAVVSDGKAPLAVPYALSAASIPADDHGDTLATATRLALGSEVAAVFDLGGDRDSFSVDLQAGQRVVLTATAVGTTNIAFRAQWLDPQGQPIEGHTFNSTGSQVRFAAVAGGAGRYTLELTQRDTAGTPAAPGTAAYTVRATPVDEDDVPDLAPRAATIGQAIAGALDLPGDVDAFRFDLEAGRRYQFDMALPTSAGLRGAVQLRLFDPAGVEVREGTGAPGVFAGMTVEAEATGTYTLRAQASPAVRAASLGDGAYQITSRLLAADDHAGTFARATAIEPGATTTLRFDQATDVDLLRFTATAGQRFTASLDSATGTPAPAFLQIAGSAAELGPLLHFGEIDARQLGRTYGAAAENGTLTVVITPRPQAVAPAVDVNAVYTLSLSAMGGDDHADVRSLATALQAGTKTAGKLDLFGDTDWFRVDLAAGQRYRFELGISANDRARGVVPSLDFVDAAGLSPFADLLGAPLTSPRFVFTPSASGSYYLAPRQVGEYEIRFDALPSDDRSDTAAGTDSLITGQPYTAEGLNAQGGEPAEYFVGTARDDVFAGAGGNDVFFGGGGNDRIDGGAGADMARFSGVRGDFTLTRTAAGWTVQDRLGRDGTDALVGVERLGFALQSAALALDLEGNAGAVAKTIGALFGKSWLERPEIAGIGLKLMDEGTSYPELVALAVGSDLFAQLAGSRSNSDFVRLVYTNVVGRAPTSADLVFYTNLLDLGSHSQASLGLLAAETAENRANIDLVGLSANGLDYLPQ